MKTILFAVAVLLVASCATAQPAPDVRPVTDGVKAAAISFALAANLDALTTWQGQRDHTIVEVNPMYAHMSPGLSLAVGEAVDVATIALSVHVSRQHPTAAKIVLWTLTGLRVYATARGFGALTPGPVTTR